jgi:hypothetical protein
MWCIWCLRRGMCRGQDQCIWCCHMEWILSPLQQTRPSLPWRFSSCCRGCRYQCLCPILVQKIVPSCVGLLHVSFGSVVFCFPISLSIQSDWRIEYCLLLSSYVSYEHIILWVQTSYVVLPLFTKFCLGLKQEEGGITSEWSSCHLT